MTSQKASLADLVNELRLSFAERRDRLQAQQAAIARGDKRVTFTLQEISMRRSRLPALEALGRGMAELAARRAEVPEWILQAFEGGGDV